MVLFIFILLCCINTSLGNVGELFDLNTLIRCMFIFFLLNPTNKCLDNLSHRDSTAILRSFNYIFKEYFYKVNLLGIKKSTEIHFKIYLMLNNKKYQWNSKLK